LPRGRADFNKDYATALRELQLLAQQGNAPAQYQLGVRYATGQGVVKDYAEAVRLYRQAAVQGYAPAQYHLGLLYAWGMGVTHDLAEARRWYAQAAETYPPGPDRENAIQARDRVARQLAAPQPPVSQPAAVVPSTPVSASPSAPVTAAITTPAPVPVSPSPPRAEEIPLVKVGGVYELSVEINGVLKLPFVLDSGAAEVNMPADVVLTLLRTGTIKETDFLPGATYVLADGSKLKSPRFMIRSLKIGKHSITNVSASVGNVPSTPLLGQSLLAKLGTWGIDNQKQVLILSPGRH
jgi:hypothetical protein